MLAVFGTKDELIRLVGSSRSLDDILASTKASVESMSWQLIYRLYSGTGWKGRVSMEQDRDEDPALSVGPYATVNASIYVMPPFKLGYTGLTRMLVRTHIYGTREGHVMLEIDYQGDTHVRGTLLDMLSEKGFDSPEEKDNRLYVRTDMTAHLLAGPSLN